MQEEISIQLFLSLNDTLGINRFFFVIVSEINDTVWARLHMQHNNPKINENREKT